MIDSPDGVSLEKSRATLPLWAGFAGLLIWTYFPTLKWMVARWDEAESYMAHGWLIPPISLYLFWQVRERLRTAPRSSSLSGFFIILAALVFHLIAGLADVSSISGLTLVAVIFGFTLLQFGWGVARVAWFPILFLLFMVPPPRSSSSAN